MRLGFELQVAVMGIVAIVAPQKRARCRSDGCCAPR
jgi:hypothetical protein